MAVIRNCLLLGVFWLAGCEAADPRVHGSFEAVVQPRAEQIGCGHSKAQLSPDGSMVALHVEPFRERFWNAGVPYPKWPLLDVISTECFARTASWEGCDVGRLQVVRGSVIDTYWAESNDVLFVNSNSSALVAVRADRSRRSLEILPVAMKLDRRLSSAISVVGPVPSRDAEEEWARRETLTTIRDALMYRKFGVLRYDDIHLTSSGNAIALLGRRRQSIDMDVFVKPDSVRGENLPESMLTLGGMRGLLRTIRLHQGLDGYWWLVGGGDALRRSDPDTVGPRWSPAERPNGFGTREIIEVESGKLIGLHTENDVRWVMPDSRLMKLRTSVNAQLGLGGVIHSMQVSTSGGRAFALIHDMARGGVYSLFSWDVKSEVWRAATLVCKSEAAVDNLSAETFDVGEPGWRIPARWYRRPGARRLLIYLHGGPESSLIRDGFAETVRHYATHGHDVVTFDYSGAVGVGFDIANRASAGAKAWLKDADIIAAYLRGATRGYERVSLAAESFGAFLAPTIIESLDDRLYSVSLGVPFFKYRLPDEMGRDGPGLVISKLRDQMYLGLDSAGVRELESAMVVQQSRMRPDSRFLVYFGTKDEKSRAEDFFNRGSAVVEIVDGGHNVSSTYITCWHEDLCRPPDKYIGRRVH